MQIETSSFQFARERNSLNAAATKGITWELPPKLATGETESFPIAIKEPSFHKQWFQNGSFYTDTKRQELSKKIQNQLTSKRKHKNDLETFSINIFLISSWWKGTFHCSLDFSQKIDERSYLDHLDIVVNNVKLVTMASIIYDCQFYHHNFII